MSRPDCYVSGVRRASGAWCWTWGEAPGPGLPLVLRGPAPEGQHLPAEVLEALAEHLPGEALEERVTPAAPRQGVWAVWVQVPALAG